MSIVQVRNLTRTYKQGSLEVQALRGVDLDIEPGEFTVLMGPSGSGKTTLLNQIGALDLPDGGSVKVEGRELAGMSKGELAKLRLDRLGFVAQGVVEVELPPGATHLAHVQLEGVVAGLRTLRRPVQGVDLLTRGQGQLGLQ